MSNLTYGDFIRTGEQDCSNAISVDEFDITIEDLTSSLDDRALAVSVVQRELDTWDSESWLASQEDDFDGLDPATCYDAWRDGWTTRAIEIIKSHISEARSVLAESAYGDPDEESADAL